MTSLMPKDDPGQGARMGRITITAATVRGAAEIAQAKATKGFDPLPVFVRLEHAEPSLYGSSIDKGTTGVNLWECDFEIFHDATRSVNLPPPERLCGAWPERGGCVLPYGHNMGKVDFPAMHTFPGGS